MDVREIRVSIRNNIFSFTRCSPSGEGCVLPNVFHTLGGPCCPEMCCFLLFPTVSLYTFDKTKQCIGTMTIEIDFLQKKNIDSNPYDTDKMAAEFIQQFNSQAFSVGQQVGFALGL